MAGPEIISGWLPFRANKQAECDYLFSALRRLEIRGVTENGADADRVQTYGL